MSLLFFKLNQNQVLLNQEESPILADLTCSGWLIRITTVNKNYIMCKLTSTHKKVRTLRLTFSPKGLKIYYKIFQKFNMDY